MLIMAQMRLEREMELRKDDVAQLQFEVDQMKRKTTELQSKLVSRQQPFSVSSALPSMLYPNSWHLADLNVLPHYSMLIIYKN